MDIIAELIRYIIIIIIGIILINWYVRKKGWDYRFRISLYFILCWRTVIFLILIVMNLILDQVLDPASQTYPLYPLIIVIITFIVNIFLGVKIFNFIYKQNTQESFVIILIIVIIEMILESFLFYTILIPETLKWLYY